MYDSDHRNTHILIDMNQLLHVALRRSKNEDHALTMVLKELDVTLEAVLSAISVQQNNKRRQPNRHTSIVLALDGPPCAAKIVTQRRRRWNTLNRASTKERRFSTLAKRGLIYKQKNNNGKSKGHGKTAKKRVSEEATICITPGTEFMKKANMALEFWAWQRLGNPNGPIAQNKCHIFISSSDIPGEGEVKLLDWVISSSNDNEKGNRVNQGVVREGDNLIFMGGDSDLVLEALILPLSITHNVYVGKFIQSVVSISLLTNLVHVIIWI